PPAVDAATTRALANAPADRFATAAQFAEALTPSVGRPARLRLTARSVLAAGAVTAAVAAVVATGLHWREGPGTARDPALGDVGGREGGDRVDRLADSVTYSVLRALGHVRPAGALPAGPLGSPSLPAVKAFLRGEQLYRQRSWDSAGAYYGRAVSIDSTFA